MLSVALCAVALLSMCASGSDSCTCVPARKEVGGKGKGTRLTWLPQLFCCKGVSSIGVSGVSCMGDGPFRDNSCSSRVRALPPGPHALGVLGYHEGAKRVLSCSENGKIIGIEVGWNVPDGKDNSMYTERFVSEVQILCSSGKIDLSFGSKELNLRKVNDSISFGATMHNATDKMRAQCSEDGSSSVTGLAWRETQKRNAGAARISGLTVLCSSGEVAHSKHSVFLPAGEDATAMKEHDRSFLCRDLTDASTLSKLAIWFHARSMAGIDFLECKELYCDVCRGCQRCIEKVAGPDVVGLWTCGVHDQVTFMNDPLIGHARSSKYRFLATIGSGGNAFVYKYLDVETSNVVAIKFIHIHQPTPINKYVEYEISNHRRLHHPHVIEFHEAFLTENFICVVMECAQGGDLFSFVKKHGRLSEAGARWFFQQMIAALDYCHSVGVVVRDIKLENCLLHIVPDAPLPILKLCDFGFSKGSTVSDPKSYVGTLAYMAPEVLQTTGTTRYDGSLADLWSAGVMLYVMLFGSYPFDPLSVNKPCGPASTLSIAKAIMSGSWSFPAEASISPGCRQVLQRLLVVNPGQRMTMQDLMRNEWFLTDLPPATQQMNELCLQDSKELDKLSSDHSDGGDSIKKLLQEAIEKQQRFWDRSKGSDLVFYPWGHEVIESYMFALRIMNWTLSKWRAYHTFSQVSDIEN